MANWFKLLPFFLWILGTTTADDHLVMTPSGPVRGTTTKTFTGKEVDAFYGIPYAEPPVGSLRFGPPVEVQTWTQELNATGFSRPCYQQIPSNYMLKDTPPEMRAFMPKRPWSEDCLKLHVWIPKPRPTNATVMVYIHGGAFVMGDPLSPFFNVATLAAEENVIVVTMHYRLGILGFLYLGVPEAPGNAGLMDQQLALKWVQRNIASFGGNPSDVTIFGLSAGGSSAAFHLLAPGSGNLFKRAIIMSGTPNSPWSPESKEAVLQESLQLVKYQGCAPVNGSRTEMVQCMQSLHPEYFSQYDIGHQILEKICAIGPTVDGNFISDSPINLLRHKQIHQADVMIGTTAAEMAGFLIFLYPELLAHTDGRTSRKQAIAIIEKEFMNHDAITKQMMMFLVTNWTHPNDPYLLRDNLVDVLSDYFFLCPSQEFADMCSSAGNKVYRYVVDFTTKIFPFPDWVRSSHGADALLHTGMAAGGGQFSEAEANLSKKVMAWWANFARTGNPNGKNPPSGEVWPQSTLEGQEYLTIALHPSVGRNFRKEQCGLLLNFMETMAEHRRSKT